MGHVCLPLLLGDSSTGAHAIVVVITGVSTTCVGFLAVGVVLTKTARGVL